MSKNIEDYTIEELEAILKAKKAAQSAKKPATNNSMNPFDDDLGDHLAKPKAKTVTKPIAKYTLRMPTMPATDESVEKQLDTIKQMPLYKKTIKYKRPF